LEQARRSTLADHVHRNARLGLQVLIRESWYYQLADAWRDKCLLGSGSLLWEGEQVWTKEALEAFKTCFTDNPDESGDSFEAKFQRQLSDQDAAVTKLAAELVLVYFLFTSSVSGSRKRDLIQKIVWWKQIEIPSAGVAAMAEKVFV